MTEDKLSQFKEDINSFLTKKIQTFTNEDVKIFYLVVVTNHYTPSIQYKELEKALVNDYGWSEKVVDNNLHYEIDDVAQDFAKANDLEWGEDEDDELECCYDTFEDDEEYDDAEVVTFPTSQYIMNLPNYRKHSQLINSEEGIDKFGSSAYLVETSWLDDFRDANLYQY